VVRTDNGLSIVLLVAQNTDTAAAGISCYRIGHQINTPRRQAETGTSCDGATIGIAAVPAEGAAGGCQFSKRLFVHRRCAAGTPAAAVPLVAALLVKLLMRWRRRPHRQPA
jgi:hypothetical protein